MGKFENENRTLKYASLALIMTLLVLIALFGYYLKRDSDKRAKIKQELQRNELERKRLLEDKKKLLEFEKQHEKAIAERDSLKRVINAKN